MALENFSKLEQIVLMLQSEHFTKVEGLPEGSNYTYKTVIPLPDDRSQLVFIQVNDTIYQLSSPFAEVDDLSAEEAFEANVTLLGVDIVFDRYSLIVANFTNAFEIESFVEIMSNLAFAADAMEKSLGGGDEL